MCRCIYTVQTYSAFIWVTFLICGTLPPCFNLLTSPPLDEVNHVSLLTASISLSWFLTADCPLQQSVDTEISSCCDAVCVGATPEWGSDSRGCENWPAVLSLALLSTSWFTSVTGNSSVDLGPCVTSNFVIWINKMDLIWYAASCFYCFPFLTYSITCQSNTVGGTVASSSLDKFL